jgi:hypothetical protein
MWNASLAFLLRFCIYHFILAAYCVGDLALAVRAPHPNLSALLAYEFAQFNPCWKEVWCDRQV